MSEKLLYEIEMAFLKQIYEHKGAIGVDDAPKGGSAGNNDPFTPANNGAPLILDMSNIPNPDDFDEGAVW